MVLIAPPPSEFDPPLKVMPLMTVRHQGSVQKAVRDALIAFMAATAQAQAEATKAAQRAGIEHAKQTDKCAYLGRKPSFTRAQFMAVGQQLGQNPVLTQIAKDAAAFSRQTVYRIKDDPAACEASLAAWGL